MMKDFWITTLRNKEKIDGSTLSTFNDSPFVMKKEDAFEIALKICKGNLKFENDILENDKNVFLSKLIKFAGYENNTYFLKMIQGEKYYEIATKLLGGSDFSIEEFKKFFAAADILGYARYYDLNSDSNVNIMQLAMLYGRHDAYLYLKDEAKMNPLEFITGDDLALDGQRFYRSRKIDGVEMFSPTSNNSKQQSDTPYIQERVKGIRFVLKDLINLAKNKDNTLQRWINDNYIQNIAAYYELIDVLEELYKDPNITINPVSPKGRDSSPAQIFMANDLRKKAPEFISILKKSNENRHLELDNHSVGYAVINYPEEWDFLFSKIPSDTLDYNTQLTNLLLLSLNENINDKANYEQRLNYISNIIDKYPLILNGFTENFQTIQLDILENNLSLYNLFQRKFLENFDKINKESSDLLINKIIQKVTALDQNTKNQLLKAAIHHGKADIVDKLIFEQGVNPDDLVTDQSTDKTLKTKVIELAKDCTDEKQKIAIRRVLRKYKKIEEKAFELVSNDLRESYVAMISSPESGVRFADISKPETNSVLSKYEGVKPNNEEFGFGLKVKAFIKLLTSKLSWNDAKVSTYYDEKIKPKIKADLDVGLNSDAAPEAKQNLKKLIEEKKSEVMEGLRR